MTGFAAAVVEAWQELRIHKLRVLLSLVGVGVAVCSLTTAVAVGQMAKQALVEQSEKQEGRPATYGVYAYSETGAPADMAETRRAFAATMKHFGITYHSIVAETDSKASLGGRSRSVMMRVVDPAYADMRRIIPAQGRWLTAHDAKNLSPAIVVNAKFLKRLGIQPGSLPAAVTFHADQDVTATIVGQLPTDGNFGGPPTAIILADAYDRWFSASRPLMDASFQMWIPPDSAKPLAKAVRTQLMSQLPDMQLGMDRQDYRATQDDPYRVFTYVVGGISALILLLGALSLLNIALVTIKQRVREIGIRRSFGATTGRVFFSVMMESIVATFVAGLIGVIAAIGIAKSPIVADLVLDGVTDVPAFPLSAAMFGLLVSLFVGALAGILPATIAVRVKIIDAIRF